MVDSYIQSFPAETQELLQQLRAAIRQSAPGSTEVISYGMPGYKFHGMVAWFAGYKHHIGFYPGASGIAAFREELAGYKCSKGTVQFPLGQPLPLELVMRIVRFRVEENLKKRARRP